MSIILAERAGHAEDFAAIAYASPAPGLGGGWDAEHFEGAYRPEWGPLRSKG
ncbi:hypothetical protein [Kitasatospora xanthocidica]|uniref:hypothetical protein n=1 Tax=Kitasatospora xanthocidica TaxID=83382 RepID=UPI0015F32C93|nr:hypothetical protein [Kitasatospora xanthocidica]